MRRFNGSSIGSVIVIPVPGLTWKVENEWPTTTVMGQGYQIKKGNDDKVAILQEPVSQDKDIIYEHPDRNWEGDSGHENGNYINRCQICDNYFRGHKGRVVCKHCSYKNVSVSSEKDESQEWIKCSERFPDQGRWCIIYSWRGIMMASFWETSWAIFDWRNPGYRIDLSDVSHWMPLPSTPKSNP